jgi:hypoxanthine phosphoribosyltransferase
MSNDMRCELISWAEVHRLCRRLARLVKDSGYRPDTVVAIGRGGLIPARLVCDCLDIMALTSIKIDHYRAGSSRQAQAVIRFPLCTEIGNQRVLLVDDVNDSGDTLQTASSHLNEFHPREVRTAVMHHKTTTRIDVDYYARKIIKWRWLVYPWAMQEDISAFLERLTPSPSSLENAQQQLADQYGIRISRKLLREVYEFAGRPKGVD